MKTVWQSWRSGKVVRGNQPVIIPDLSGQAAYADMEDKGGQGGKGAVQHVGKTAPPTPGADSADNSGLAG